MNEPTKAHSSVELRLSGVGDPAEEQRALRDWLSYEPDFRGSVTEAVADTSLGAMGALSDALIVAVGSGGALTVLMQSVNAWLQSRRPELSVEVTKADGSVVRVTASGTAAVTVAEKMHPPM